jgi:hypothetical protein
MVNDDTPLLWHVARAASYWMPLSWLVLRARVCLFGWDVANGDSANPVVSPLREIAVSVLDMPLFLFPVAWWDLLQTWVGEDCYLVAHFGINALCWGFLLLPWVPRRLARMLLVADFLAELLVWQDSGLLGLIGL